MLPQVAPPPVFIQEAPSQQQTSAQSAAQQGYRISLDGTPIGDLANYLQNLGGAFDEVRQRKDDAEDTKAINYALRKPVQGGFGGGNSKMVLTTQIQKVEQMKKDLTNFCSMMKRYMDEVHTKLQSLKAQGFPKEKCEDYENLYFQPANKTVVEVINRITAQHYRYLDDVKIGLQKALNRK